MANENIQGGFFILRYRNILRNTHRIEKMFAIESLYFQGGKITPQKLTPRPGSGRGDWNFKWEPLFFITDSNSPLKNT